LIVLLILIMAVFLNLFIPFLPSKAGTVNSFTDGSSELIIDFPGSGSKYIKVPVDSNVTKCTVDFTTLANNDGIYPENIELKFTEKALLEIVRKSLNRKTGARGLRSIIEKVMLDVMYKIPSIDNVTECLVTEEVILGNAEPVLKYGKSKKSA